jgi:hypothetical protein
MSSSSTNASRPIQHEQFGWAFAAFINRPATPGAAAASSSPVT